MAFSIIIPLYNKEQTIRRAILSVLEQINNVTGKRMVGNELIIVDDGSTDNSLAIAKQIQKEQTQHKIIIYPKINSGVSAARNTGVKLARNELVTFLDADDTYEPDFLSEIQTLITKFPVASMFATRYRFVDTNTDSQNNASIAGLSLFGKHQKLKNFFDSAASGDLPITSSSVCIRKSSLRTIGGFPEGENMGEDQAVWSQLALRYPIAISKNVCASYYENTAESLMQTQAPNKEMPFSQRLQVELDRNRIPTKRIYSVKQYIAGHLLDLVRRNIEAGDLKSARQLIDDSRSRGQFKRWVYLNLKLRLKIMRVECAFGGLATHGK